MSEIDLLGDPRPQRTRRRQVEQAIQVGFFKLVFLHERRWPVLRLVMSIPNGGVRPRVQDHKGRWYSPQGLALKEAGLRPGYPDVQCPVARAGFIGWACEFKAPGSYPTPEQRCCHEALRAENWRVIVRREAKSAWDDLLNYLGFGA